MQYYRFSEISQIENLSKSSGKIYGLSIYSMIRLKRFRSHELSTRVLKIS